MLSNNDHYRNLWTKYSWYLPNSCPLSADTFLSTHFFLGRSRTSYPYKLFFSDKGMRFRLSVCLFVCLSKLSCIEVSRVVKWYGNTLEHSDKLLIEQIGRDLQRKAAIVGRRPLMEDDLCWKTTFDGRWPLMEDNLWWKTPFDGRKPLMEDCLW